MSGRTTARLLTRLAQAATRLDPAIVGPLLLLGIVLGMIVILRGQKDHELVAQVTAGNLKLPEFYTAQNAITATAAQAAAGAAVLVGVFFTLRNLRISQESQVTSRYIQAVTQLGSDKLAVRLGGIYALERVAWDSERDHQTVMDVLTAYVREHLPWPPPDQSAHSLLILPLSARRPETIPAPRESLPADIQAILTVLGRRRPRHRQRESHVLSFPWTDLRSADLRGAHLEGTYLVGAHLEGADLVGVLDLTLDQIRYANIDSKTTLPPELRRAWEVWLAGHKSGENSTGHTPPTPEAPPITGPGPT
jgi:hypothetical protein